MEKKLYTPTTLHLSFYKKLLLLTCFILAGTQTTYSQTSALTFDGVDSYVQLSNSLSIGSSSNTVEMWLKIPLVGNNNLTTSERVGVILGNFDDATNANWEIHSNGEIRFYWNGGELDVSGTTDLRDNTWHHLAFIRDKTNNKLLAYIDGNLEFDQPDSGSDITFTTNHRIGNDNRASGNPYFHGEMDEIRIWNTARSQTEIRENMFKQLAGNESGLVHYYKMSTGSGSTLTDNSTNSNSGNITNATWSADAFIPAGDGTSGNPYQIASITNLLWISENSSTWSSHLEQTADIDASYTANLDDANGGDKEGFQPIGNGSSPFWKSYEGNSHVIDGLYINRTSETNGYVGLFGRFNGTNISNLSLTNLDITGTNMTAGLVGSTSSGNIINCSSSGTIVGNANTGGLVGYNNLQVGSITQSYSTGSIEGDNTVGGLVGYNVSGNIIESHSTSSVVGNRYQIGGLVGKNSEEIKRSYATGSVNGDYSTGGLAGTSAPGSVIDNSYATGTVTANSTAGGLIGNTNEATVNFSYSTGSVVSSGSNVGGFLGFNLNSTISNSFWNIDSSGQPSSAAGEGKTTDEMKFFHTFFYAGWDLEMETTNGTNNYWDLDDGSLNDGYPILSWQQAEVNLAEYSSDITGSEGWRLLSSPLFTSFSELLEPIWTQGGSDADWSGGTPNIYTWNNTATSISETFWNEVTNLNQAISEGTGFLVNVYADDNYDGSDETFPKTLTIIGVEPSGTVSPALNTNNDGWSLLGNPFAGTIDFDQLTKADLTNVAYVLKSDGSGDYISWNGITGDVTDGLISPFQGFFVQNVASPTNPSLTFDSSQKLKQQNDESERIAVRLQIEGDKMVNSAWLQFSEEGDYKKQVMGDALELTPLNYRYIQLAVQKKSKLYDIAHLPNSLDSEETAYEIPLDISSTAGETFMLTATDIELPQNIEVTFHDYKTGYTEKITEDFLYNINLEPTKEKRTESKRISNVPLLAKATAGNGNRFTVTVNLSNSSLLEEPIEELPTAVALDQNYPNPFNPATNIKYQLPGKSRVRLTVYDLTGRMVAKLVEGEMPAGTHTIHFDASNLSSGVYIYQLATNKTQITRKLTLIK